MSLETKTSKKKPVENKELWMKLYNLKNKFKEITFIHCYGHGDNKENNKRINKGTNEIDIITDIVFQLGKVL